MWTWVGMRPQQSIQNGPSHHGWFHVPPVERGYSRRLLVKKPAAPVSTTRGDRTGLLFHRATPTTIQAGQHDDDETRIEVHRSFIQHCSLALITGIHSPTVTRGKTLDYQPKAPLIRRKR